MLIKISGRMLEPQTAAPDDTKQSLWDWLIHGHGKGLDLMSEMNSGADHLVQGEADYIVKPFLGMLKAGVLHLNHDIVSILPELTVFIAVILVSIGMFTQFGKWLVRGVLVFIGGMVWITLGK